MSRASASRTHPGRSCHMKCPAPGTISTHEPGIAAAVSVLAELGIGLSLPARNPNGTRTPPSAAASAGSAALADA
jgi:hypothetical protein